jgi:hypothetical protein
MSDSDFSFEFKKINCLAFTTVRLLFETFTAGALRFADRKFAHLKRSAFEETGQ